jgi:hypothetical protein
MLKNYTIIEMTKDITIAKLNNITLTPNKESGKSVADFMQVIYDKIVELNEKDANQ